MKLEYPPIQFTLNGTPKHGYTNRLSKYELCLESGLWENGTASDFFSEGKVSYRHSKNGCSARGTVKVGRRLVLKDGMEITVERKAPTAV